MSKTMQFYHDIITQKSYDFLQELKRQYKFILIGGWAVYFYARALKSKDIDIIVGYSELAKLKENQNVFKNERLKKYEIKTGEFDIDIYLGHYSDLGVDIADIEKSAIVKQGFLVPRLEVLFLLKLFAWQNRRGSVKGQKDEIDILSLAQLPEFDWQKYKQLVEKYNFGQHNRIFIELVKKKNEIKELAVNRQKMSKLRKMILGKLAAAKS
jgi:hypothetical protein